MKLTGASGTWEDAGVAQKPKALVTAPFRGEGLTTLQRVADVVLDPWIDAPKLRLYKAEQLAERVRDEGATILVVESDSVKGPVLECDLRVDRVVPRRPQQRRHRGRNRGPESRC